MQPAFLFVYGTLKRNTAMHHLLAEHASLIGAACFRGRLYRIAHYPGVVASENPADVVHGELYALDNDSQVLTRLDRYEECGEGFAQPTEYIRSRRRIVLEDGREVDAWIYLYNWMVEESQRIASGIFADD